MRTFKVTRRVKNLVTMVSALTLAVAVTAGAGGGGGKTPATNNQDGSNDAKKPTYIAGEVVVAVEPGTALSYLPAAPGEGGPLNMSGGADVYLLKIGEGDDPETVAKDLMDSSWTLYAHPNYVLQEVHPVQGSYPFSDRLSLGDYETQTASVALNVSDARAVSTGAGVRVAVIDGGVDVSHALLGGAAVYGYDFVDFDDEPADEAGGSASGHGTFVAGVTHLVAPDAELVAYRIMDEFGRGDGFTLARAIVKAVDDGCDVINLSVVLVNRHLAVRDAINYAETNGVIVVAAAGNAATDAITYPAAELAPLAVSAVDTADSRAEFANYGDFVDVYAPGTNIYSAFESGERAWWSGTSFSTPFVSGQVAGLLELRPSATIDELKDAVKRSADKPQPTTPEDGVIDLLGSFNRIMDTLRAYVSPDTISLTHEQGRMYFVNPRATVAVSSDNAPASYSVEIAPAADLFVCPQETAGLTDDSLVIEYCYFEGLAPGDYYNTVLFHVNGITDPAELTVKLTVVEADTTGTQTASVTPSEISFTHTQGATYITPPKSVVFVTSDNAPANYTVEIDPNSDLIACPEETGGMTNDSLVVQFCNFDSLDVGEYLNILRFHVDGIAEPAILTVRLTVVEGDTSGTPTASVSPSALYLSAPVTSSELMYATVALSSSNSPATYSGFALNGGAGFTTVIDSVGVTPDSVRLRIDHSGLTTPGTYIDTVLFHIDGVPGSTLLGIALTLTGDSGSTYDSAVVTPSISFLTVPQGIDTAHQMTLTVSASGAPKPFVASHLQNPGLVEFIDSVGFTRTLGSVDTLDGTASLIHYNVVSSAAWPAGVYVDTILVDVDGVINSPLVAIQYLNVTDSLQDTTGTDTTGNDTTGNDTTGGLPLAEEVYISQSTGVDLGQEAIVGLATQAYRTDIGGFELLVTYDGTALTLSSVTEGSVITKQGWEYFTSTVYNAGSADATVRVIGIADLNNGANHPGDSTLTSGESFAALHFQTPTDSSYVGVFSPIRWIWQDCGDNTLSNLTGDTAFISRSVFDYYGSSDNPWTNYRTPLTDTLGSLPSLGGAPLLCGGGARAVDFLNGGIWFAGGDTLIDTTGNDTTGTDTTGNDTTGGLPLAEEVYISQSTGVDLGQEAIVGLATQAYRTDIGGFELLVTYDGTALTLTSVAEGSVYSTQGWEYFNSTVYNAGSADATVRVVGIADLNNGANYSGDSTLTSGESFAALHFQTPTDSSYVGVFSPIRWIWQDCGDNTLSNLTGDTAFISRSVFDYYGSSDNSWTNYRTPLTDTLGSLPSLGGAPLLCGGGVRAVDFLNGGIWFAGGDTLIDTTGADTTGNDTTGNDTTGTDTTVIDSSAQLVRISQTSVAPGQDVAVNLVSDSYSPGMGGFDFLVSYDDNVLTLLGVDAGSVITNNGWEYFTTRSDNDGNGMGYVRVVSVADLNDGANHPSGFAVNSGDTFAHLNFQVSADTTLSGVFSPVSWLWMDCGDNGIANQAGDTLYVSREVYDYSGSGSSPAYGHRAVLTAPGAALPSFGGAPTNCVGGAVRHTDFFNGGVLIMVDTLGDTTAPGAGDSRPDAALAEVSNYPNPFNPSTTISFKLGVAAQPTLTIYDILGRKVKTIEMGELSAGRHRVVWNSDNENGHKVASGVYLYRLDVGATSISRTMILLK